MMLHTGQKKVDPLIVTVWPLAPGKNSRYSLYEDSGASVLYQRGVFTRTPIRASQSDDSLDRDRAGAGQLPRHAKVAIV